MNNKELLKFLNKVKFKTRTLTYAVYDSNGKKTVAIILPSSFLDRRLTYPEIRSIEIMEQISIPWRNAALHNYKALKECHARKPTDALQDRIEALARSVAKDINAIGCDIIRFFAGGHECCPGMDCFCNKLASYTFPTSIISVCSLKRLRRIINNKNYIREDTIFTYLEGSQLSNRSTLTYDDAASYYDLEFLPDAKDIVVKSFKTPSKTGSMFYKDIVEQSMYALCSSCNNAG